MNSSPSLWQGSFGRRALLALALLLLGGGADFVSPAPAQTGSGPAILDSYTSYWRCFYVVSSPVTRSGNDVKKVPCMVDDTPAPPKQWTAADFDDSTWARVVGKPFVTKGAKDSNDAGITELDGSSPALAMICVRGKFGVTDPGSAGNLKLSLSYRGGVIVYVNGTEVGRANMPKDAAGPAAVADNYPKEAFLKADGSLAAAGGRGGDKSVAAARVRTTEVVIPSKALRKGANVLAIEIHRAAYSSEMMDVVQSAFIAKRQQYQLYGMLWSTCGLNSATLTGGAPAVTPNITRPRGFQVWNSQPMQPDVDLDYGDPFEPLVPITLVGPRNGVCSGKVVVGCDQPIRNLKAQMSDLAGKSGGSIPAAAVKVRYALPTGEEPVFEDHYPALPDLCDGLAEVPPPMVEVRAKKKGVWPFGAVCPVWVTVAIPAGAGAGEYSGKLSITADGLTKTDVTVNLKVCPWVAPKPSEFTTAVDIMQSPESVALQYNVPVYSDKHFKLLEKSLERAGYLGSWTLHVPLICQSNIGNEQTMVRWIKQPGGTYKYDFTPLEKYLDLADKYMGKPRAISLIVWDLFLGLGDLNGLNWEHNMMLPKDFKFEEVPVSFLDESNGKVTMGTVGRYDDKGKAPWKALIEQLMDRLRKRGLEKNIHIGHSYDICPPDEIVRFWNDLLPGVNYMRYGHYDYRTFGKGNPPPWKSDFIVFEWAPGWSIKPAYGWKNPVVELPWIRLKSERGSGAVWKSDPYVTVPLTTFRVLSEAAVQGPYRGFGRLGLDFWPVLEDEKGRKNAVGIQGRYTKSSWRQSDEMIMCVSVPGPDGALSSAKIETIREGLQETEARIQIEKALLGGRGGPRAQAVLDGRVKAMQMMLEAMPIAGISGKKGDQACLDGFSFGGLYAPRHSAIFQQWLMASGWQARSEELFDAAAGLK